MKSVIDEKNISTLIEVPVLASQVDEKNISTVLEFPSVMTSPFSSIFSAEMRSPLTVVPLLLPSSRR